jgi:hypothetical protein
LRIRADHVSSILAHGHVRAVTVDGLGDRPGGEIAWLADEIRAILW